MPGATNAADLIPNGSRTLLVLLHGSGRDGRSLLDQWQSLAKKEGIILLGLESFSVGAESAGLGRGATFWLRWKTLSGSYRRFTALSRS